MKRLLICDLDGTIVDSMHFLSTIGVAVLKLARPELSHAEANEHYHTTVGMPFFDQLRTIGEGSVDEYVALYTHMHREACGLFPLTKFGRELRAFPVTPSFSFALVSSTHRNILTHMPQLRTIKWASVLGYRGPGSEKALQIIETCGMLGVSVRTAVYIGDTPSDRAIAGELGMAYFNVEHTSLSDVLGVYRENFG